MFKTLALATIVGTALMTTTAFAQSATTMNCAAEMKKTETMMMQTADQMKKDKAMKELSMAKDMSAKNDEKGCMMHNDNAMKALK